MANIHQIFESSIRKPPPFGQSEQQGIVGLHASVAVDRQSPITPLDKSLETLSNVAKLGVSTAPYRNYLNDKNKIARYEREIANIKSNYWLVPNNEIHGLSGYICRRCNLISSTSIRDIGYDMTMQARHICDEEKVKSIKMVSIRPQDVWSLEDHAAGMFLDRLNYLMPGQKYVLGNDISKSFDSLEKMNPSITKLLLGIPDRHYLYSIKNDERIPWLERVIANLGMKTLVEESEIRDFLRRVTSTYAIFEVPIGQVLRRILIKITI